MFAMFTLCTAAWAYIIWANKQHAHKIHYLMFALGCLKSLTLMSQVMLALLQARRGTLCH